jgi:predicted esterase
MVTNREQLALDAVETASHRFLIDPRRVYITGLSGGGRVSSIMQACFPDVFMGAIPIAGMSSYQHVPNGLGQFWRAAYARPGSDTFRVFKGRRMAGITGERDGNAREMRNATNIMRRDGLNVKLFDYPDMAHELPTPERFLDALKWIDEPAVEAMKAEKLAAAKAWDTYKTRFPDETATDEAARRLLVKVTEAAPWTPQAWRAAEILGLTAEIKPVGSP